MLNLSTIVSLFLIKSAFAEVLLLGLGSEDAYEFNNQNGIFRDNFDVVNIDSTLGSYGSYCSPLPNFPYTSGLSAGGLVNGRIVICGGYMDPFPIEEITGDCWASDAAGWQYIGNLSIPKRNHAAANLPNGDLWITGGADNDQERYYTTHIVTANMEVIRGPNMPSVRSAHCVAQLNSTTMMLVGGFELGHKVDFFNVDTQQWINYGPPTKFEHGHPGCVSFTDTDGKEKVMVMGDYYYSVAGQKVELFDGESWELLDDPPFAMTAVNAVLYKDKIIVTGQDGSYDPFLSSWEFDINTRTWAPGFQMNPAISQHVSFLVPDSYCV